MYSYDELTMNITLTNDNILVLVIGLVLMLIAWVYDTLVVSKFGDAIWQRKVEKYDGFTISKDQPTNAKTNTVNFDEFKEVNPATAIFVVIGVMFVIVGFAISPVQSPFALFLYFAFSGIPMVVGHMIRWMRSQ